MDDVGDEDFAYLTTRGRRTGRPHTIEIWFAASGGRVYMLSGGGDHSDWVRNLKAEPTVGLRIGSRTWMATARPVADPEEDAEARRLLAVKYQGWTPGRPMSGWARTALSVAVDPQP